MCVDDDSAPKREGDVPKSWSMSIEKSSTRVRAGGALAGMRIDVMGMRGVEFPLATG